MLAISSYHSNRPTNKQTGTIAIHCAVQCNNYFIEIILARRISAFFVFQQQLMNFAKGVFFDDKALLLVWL